MQPELIGLIGIIAMLTLLLLRMPVALSLSFVGIVGLWHLHGFHTAYYVLGVAPLDAMHKYSLSALPLFLLMGAVALQAGLGTRLFDAASAQIGHRRGGLAVATIFASGGFGAICGSSIATVLMMGKLAIPEMVRHNYAERFAAATVAAGSTLGIIIPPSIIVIIYAYLTEVSIGKLFAACFLPGVLAIFLYAVAIFLVTAIKPDIATASERVSFRKKLKAMGGAWPTIVLFVTVMGGIVGGIFSPTEGAAVGAFGAIAIGLAIRSLPSSKIKEALVDTVKVTSMLLLILIGVDIFNFFFQATRAPQFLSTFINGLDWSPQMVMAVIILFLVLLGCFLDEVTIVFLTTPILFPIVVDLGYDPIWFGVVTVMLVELGLLTPPIGLNLFLAQQAAPNVPLKDLFKAIIPFVLANLVRIGLIFFFPAIALWLPNQLFG